MNTTQQHKSPPHWTTLATGKKSFVKVVPSQNYQGQGFLVFSVSLAIERNFTFERSEHARKVGYEAK